MTDDYRVPALSDLDVRRLVKKARHFFDVADHRWVDVLLCLKRRSIWTVKGQKTLNFQVRPDSEMGGDDAVTSYGKGIITIAVKQSVYDAALVGVGRARHTLAHEIGHAVMHERPDRPHMPRRAAGNITPKWLQPFESAEHQAKVFAAAFLINDDDAATLPSANDIAIEFGISLESATIYVDQRNELATKQETAERLRHLAEALRTSAAPVSSTRYISELCPECGQPRVFPIGNKFMCENCHTVMDKFQDGDSVGP
jgi:hypothetical protein